MMRKMKMTPAQMVMRWGEAGVSAAVKSAALSPATKDGEVEVMHAVYYRRRADDGSRLPMGLTVGHLRPWASVYFEVQTKHCLENGGAYEQPFFCVRLFRSNNEIYGRSPADAAMPEIRYLNELDRTAKQGMAKMLNESWLVPDDYPYQIDNRPGGVNYYDATKSPAALQRMASTARLDVAETMVQRRQWMIRRHFYTDTFELFTNQSELRRQKTATEVQKMTQEQLARFAPVFTSVSNEAFEPFLRRVFGIMARRPGVFDVPPESVREMAMIAYVVQYTTKLALAIRALQSAAIVDVAATHAQLAQLDPGVMHVIDWSAAARVLAQNSHVPNEIIRSAQEVKDILEAQAEAAAAQQAMQAATQGARAAKDLGPEAQAGVMDALNNPDEGQAEGIDDGRYPL
jgi:hypothetical protein